MEHFLRSSINNFQLTRMSVNSGLSLQNFLHPKRGHATYQQKTKRKMIIYTYFTKSATYLFALNFFNSSFLKNTTWSSLRSELISDWTQKQFINFQIRRWPSVAFSKTFSLTWVEQEVLSALHIVQRSPKWSVDCLHLGRSLDKVLTENEKQNTKSYCAPYRRKSHSEIKDLCFNLTTGFPTKIVSFVFKRQP